MTELKISLPKRELMMKRNIYSEVITKIDDLMKMDTKIREIIQDSGININYAMKWVRDEMDALGFLVNEEDSEEEADEEEDEPEEEEEEEGPVSE